jgi:hypothetical protein
MNSVESKSWSGWLNGAQPGTEYGPQQTKMPNLALAYHSGNGCRFSDSKVGSYFTGRLSGTPNPLTDDKAG